MTEGFPLGAVERSIPDRFTSIVARYGNRVVVRSEKEEWTYTELDARSDAIASAINGAGAVPGEAVAVLIGKDNPMIVAAFLGALKAGAIHVSLDPHAPADSTRSALEDCDAKVILTDGARRDAACALGGERRSVLQVDAGRHASGLRRACQQVTDAPALITYTSGSTGKPKGVVVSHRAALHNARNMAISLGVTPADRLAVLPTLAVMGGPRDVLAGILYGASVSLYDMGAAGIAGLAQWMQSQAVSYINMAVSVFRQFLATLDGDERFPSVRVVKSGSEPLCPADLTAITRHFEPECRVWVGYGSTETGNVTQALVDRSAVAVNDVVLVGRALAGMEILILDESSRPMAAGDAGLLAVRSSYLADGYWKRPVETARVFCPAGREGGERTYLTGDRARLHANGALEILGRNDRLVKIRGRTVDLDAVEAAMRGQPPVRQAAAIAARDPAGSVRLTGYVAWKSGAAMPIQALRAALAGDLPAHFVPAVFTVLDALPLTRQGKLDRRALPEPSWSSAGNVESRIGARSEMESAIAKIWGDVLGLERIGVTQRFLDLGGDSLTAGRIAAEVGRMLGVEIPIGVLLGAETIEAMALVATRALVDRGDVDGAARWLRRVES